jgi:hypothetical protein
MTGTLKIREEVQLGEILRVIDNISRPNIDDTFVVNQIKYIYPSGFDEIKVGDKEWKLEDDIVEMETRIKRLEEQSVRNQDLLLQLIRINDQTSEYAKFPTERYMKMTRGEYNHQNFAVWDNPDLSEYDSDYKWADEDDTAFDTELVYVKSYNNYIEDFSDEDFKDDSSDGWANLTDNQAISTEITLNEKKISTCNLNETHTGDLTFYLDNGNGWEEFVNNPHIFEEEGDYIKWKAVSTGSSTIEEVTINYKFKLKGLNI